MRLCDKSYIAWRNLPVTSGTRVLERVPLESANGLYYQLHLFNGAAGSLALFYQNIDNQTIPEIDADNTAMMQAGATGSVPANGVSHFAITPTTTFLMARFFVLTFTPSASGTATLIFNVRRLISNA